MINVVYILIFKYNVFSSLTNIFIFLGLTFMEEATVGISQAPRAWTEPPGAHVALL